MSDQRTLEWNEWIDGVLELGTSDPWTMIDEKITDIPFDDPKKEEALRYYAGKLPLMRRTVVVRGFTSEEARDRQALSQSVIFAVVSTCSGLRRQVQIDRTSTGHTWIAYYDAQLGWRLPGYQIANVFLGGYVNGCDTFDEDRNQI